MMALVLGLGVTPTSAESPGAGGAVPDARLEVHKGDRRLVLFSGDSMVASYPIGLGFQPVGPKTRQGDGATPEGEYFVCVKNPQSRYLLSLGLNYPSGSDAAVGRARGEISAGEHRAIVGAEERGVCPPWNTRLGGEIYIHGRGASRDWTLGCIALHDADMRRLYAAVRIGTRVVIKP
jgi:murein L,D-transpeptidase YafK